MSFTIIYDLISQHKQRCLGLKYLSSSSPESLHHLEFFYCAKPKTLSAINCYFSFRVAMNRDQMLFNPSTSFTSIQNFRNLFLSEILNLWFGTKTRRLVSCLFCEHQTSFFFLHSFALYASKIYESDKFWF